MMWCKHYQYGGHDRDHAFKSRSRNDPPSMPDSQCLSDIPIRRTIPEKRYQKTIWTKVALDCINYLKTRRQQSKLNHLRCLEAARVWAIAVAIQPHIIPIYIQRTISDLFRNLIISLRRRLPLCLRRQTAECLRVYIPQLSLEKEQLDRGLLPSLPYQHMPMEFLVQWDNPLINAKVISQTEYRSIFFTWTESWIDFKIIK